MQALYRIFRDAWGLAENDENDDEDEDDIDQGQDDDEDDDETGLPLEDAKCKVLLAAIGASYTVDA